METLKELVERRLRELGVGATSAAVEGGLERTFIQDIKRGQKRSVRGDKARALARALQVSVDEVLAAGDPPTERGPQPRASRTPAPGPGFDLPFDLPILGTAAGAAVGAIAIDDPIGYERRPPALLGVPGAYACYVNGDSMWPLFPGGELVYVNPHRPAQSGDNVLIQIEERPGEITAYVKQFVKMARESLCARQFNPAAEIEYKIKTVKCYHRILTGRELIQG